VWCWARDEDDASTNLDGALHVALTVGLWAPPGPWRDDDGTPTLLNMLETCAASPHKTGKHWVGKTFGRTQPNCWVTRRVPHLTNGSCTSTHILKAKHDLKVCNPHTPGLSVQSNSQKTNPTNSKHSGFCMERPPHTTTTAMHNKKYVVVGGDVHP